MAENAVTKQLKNSQGKGLMGRAVELSAQARGSGLLKHIENIEVKKMSKVIVEENGVFVIQKNAAPADVAQNPELKALIDSILK